MHWYIVKYEDSPLAVAHKIKKLDREKGIETGIPDKDKVKLAKQMQKWALAQGQNFYRPNEKSSDFFLSVARIKSIFGGNRSGKTATKTMDVLMQCEGWHPLQRPNLEKLRKEAINSKIREHCEWVLDNKLWIKSPPIAARCVAVDFPNGVEKICGVEYVKWATKSELKAVQYENEKKRRITWKNGSFVEFMTTDQELDAHGGTARDVIEFDEEPPSDYWTENMMRIISCNGRLILGMTAVKGITWVYQEIWEKWEKLLEQQGLEEYDIAA